MVKWKNPIPNNELNEWQPISVRSKSGGRIKGLFAHSKTKEQKATIVLGHPMGKEAKGYFVKRGYTELLRNNGFNTLIFDINGFGESSHGNFSYYEDIVAIGKKAKQITHGTPIGYFGISLGGQWSTIAFADKTHPYQFAIVESAATTLDEFWTKFPFAYRTLKFLNFVMPQFTSKIKMSYFVLLQSRGFCIGEILLKRFLSNRMLALSKSINNLCRNTFSMLQITPNSMI